MLLIGLHITYYLLFLLHWKILEHVKQQQPKQFGRILKAPHAAQSAGSRIVFLDVCSHLIFTVPCYLRLYLNFFVPSL